MVNKLFLRSETMALALAFFISPWPCLL